MVSNPLEECIRVPASHDVPMLRGGLREAIYSCPTIHDPALDRARPVTQDDVDDMQNRLTEQLLLIADLRGEIAAMKQPAAKPTATTETDRIWEAVKAASAK